MKCKGRVCGLTLKSSMSGFKGALNVCVVSKADRIVVVSSLREIFYTDFLTNQERMTLNVMHSSHRGPYSTILLSDSVACELLKLKLDRRITVLYEPTRVSDELLRLVDDLIAEPLYTFINHG